MKNQNKKLANWPLQGCDTISMQKNKKNKWKQEGKLA